MVRLVHARVCVAGNTASPPPRPLFRVCVLNCMRSLDARGKQEDLSPRSSFLFVPLFNPFLPPPPPLHPSPPSLSLLSFVSLLSRGRSWCASSSSSSSSSSLLCSFLLRVFSLRPAGVSSFSLPIVSSAPGVRVNLFSWPLETTLS